MGKEIDFELLRLICPHDREIIFLSYVLFWVKYIRRNEAQEGFETERPEVDFSDPGSIVMAALDLHRQEIGDPGGDVVKLIIDRISQTSARNKLFPSLNDGEIPNTLYLLDNEFEERETGEFLRGNSAYLGVAGPEEFALHTALTMLWLCGRDLEIGWMTGINKWKEREYLIKEVVKAKMGDLSPKTPPLAGF